MIITTEDFNNMSEMVKLRFIKEDETKLIKDLNQLVKFIEIMNEMDTDKEEPLAYIHSQKNNFREDVVADIEAIKGLHANAPEDINGYYVVPRIID